MLQGVRSSCPRPVCSLRSEPRSAARSRSQRATRAEASLADRGLKSYSRLQLALDKLEKSLLAPRINKEAAQGQVQMVAADTLWVASEVGRKLSRAQHSAAMAATDKEIILLHLQVRAQCCRAALTLEIGSGTAGRVLRNVPTAAPAHA